MKATPLITWPALASAALIVFNDFYLKRFHHGIISGKLSDIGLCIFLPIVTVAALDLLANAAVAISLVKTPPRVGQLVFSGCVIAISYFVFVKSFAWATHLHLALLSRFFPIFRYRAVTDPTDLVCLPFAFATAIWLARWAERNMAIEESVAGR